MRDEQEGEGLGNLGSLAQSARLKQLNTARTILIVIGILTTILSALMLFTVDARLEAELRKIPAGMMVDQNVVNQARTLEYLVSIISLILGIVYLVFAALIKSYPVPITITALTLYIASTIVMFVINPAAIKQVGLALIIRVAIIVALVRAVQAALAYQKDRDTEGLQAGAYD